MKEIWKDVRNFERLYEISNYGNIRSKQRNIKIRDFERSIKGSLKKPYDDRHGYLIIDLYKSNKRYKFKIHRLVMETFEYKTGCEVLDVNHKDGNKKNNCFENLEWCTRRENLLHAVKNDLTSQNVSTIAYKNGKEYHSKSIYGLYDILRNIENIECTRKTFGNNVLRALNNNGVYYGYTFQRG